MNRLAVPLGVASAIAGAVAVATIAPRRRRRVVVGGDATAAPLVEIRQLRGDVLVSAAQVVRVSASADVRGDTELAFDRSGETLRVALDPPRDGACLTVIVPRTTRVLVRAAQGRIGVRGVDGVEVRLAEGAVELRDVAGAIRVNAENAYVGVELASNRATTSLELQCAKSDVCVEIPSTLAACYEIDATNSETNVPGSSSSGIPVRVRVAESRLEIVNE
jgi:hypothetical protein